MPKTVREVLIALAKKAKVDIENEVFKDAMSTPDFDRVLVPDEVFTGIDNGLLDMEAAKNNYPDIKRHYYAQAYDMIDKTVIAEAQEAKLDEAIINELKNIQSTPEKVKFINRKMREHEAKKQSSGKIDKEAWLQEKAEMQELLRQAKEEVPKIKADFEAQLRAEKMTYAKRQALSRIKTIDEDLDPDVRQAMHEAIINSGLKKMNAKFDVDANGDLILLSHEDGIVYDEGHRPVNANSFMEKVFADSKRLKITEPTAQSAATKYTPTPTGQAPAQQTNGYVPGQKAANSVVLSKNAQALADYNAANAAAGLY